MTEINPLKDPMGHMKAKREEVRAKNAEYFRQQQIKFDALTSEIEAGREILSEEIIEEIPNTEAIRRKDADGNFIKKEGRYVKDIIETGTFRKISRMSNHALEATGKTQEQAIAAFRQAYADFNDKTSPIYWRRKPAPYPESGQVKIICKFSLNPEN